MGRDRLEQRPRGTGGGWDIYESERPDGLEQPRVVSFNSTANDFDPSFAPDGSGVYFFSNRDGGFGKDDIYFAPFDARTGRYGAAGTSVRAINSAGDEWAPVVSPDGKRLHVRERRPRRPRQARPVRRASAGEALGHIENLEALNTPDEDFDATFLHDGVSIVYTSGKFEGDEVALYVAEFRDGRFQPRERLPVAVNSQKAGAWTLGPSISPHDPGALYFTSEHEEGRGRADIYRIEYRMQYADHPWCKSRLGVVPSRASYFEQQGSVGKARAVCREREACTDVRRRLLG